jgi:hypothetical protein
VTDDEIMARLREIDQAAEFDEAMKCRVLELARSTLRQVTCYEVIATRAVLFIVHGGARPSMTAIRKAAEPHVRTLQ